MTCNENHWSRSREMCEGQIKTKRAMSQASIKYDFSLELSCMSQRNLQYESKKSDYNMILYCMLRVNLFIQQIKRLI